MSFQSLYLTIELSKIKLVVSETVHTNLLHKPLWSSLTVVFLQTTGTNIPCSLHQRFSGTFRYLRGLDTGNLRLGFDPSTIPSVVRRYDYGVIVRPYAVPTTPLHVHHVCEREFRHHECETSNRNED